MEQPNDSDIKYLIPLVGVFLGWLLTTLSGIAQGISEKRKILGKALSQLHFIYLEQSKVLNHFEYLKDTFGITPDYEKMRVRAMERYVLNNDNFNISIEIINQVAAIYPLIAMDLKGLIENYSFSQKIKFPASSSENGELYLKLLSSFEVAFELDHKFLRKIIFKIAYGHSIFTWIQLKWKYYKMDKRVKDLNVAKTLGFDIDLKNISADKAKKEPATTE